MEGGTGRTIERLGDVATTYDGDALLPHPGAFRHSPRLLAGPQLLSAPLDGAAQG
jgi:hypothetical protein